MMFSAWCRRVLLALILVAPLALRAQHFNGGRAYDYARDFAAIGPRWPTSPGHAKAEAFLRAHFQHDQLEEDAFTADTPIGAVKMRNFIVRFPGKKDGAIVLATHYETNYWLRNINFVGANDGAATTGLLMAIADQLRAATANGKSWKAIPCGWSSSMAKRQLRSGPAPTPPMAAAILRRRWGRDGTLGRIKAFILTDMIGDKDLDIQRETRSTHGWLTLVRQAAKKFGYERYFFQQEEPVDDDHLAFVKRGVPSIDIIDLDYGPNDSYHHTAQDTLDKISARSLTIDGDVYHGNHPPRSIRTEPFRVARALSSCSISSMIGGASWAWWIGFHAAVIALLAVDAFLLSAVPINHATHLCAWIWTGVLAYRLRLLCCVDLHMRRAASRRLNLSPAMPLKLRSASTISLFSWFSFRVSKSARRASTRPCCGVLVGAVLLRAVFIAAGVTLIDRFHWVTWVFGLFLLYAALRLMRGGSAHAAIPGWIRRLQPAKGSLLPVILAVEVTDLLFAIDSIPAVLAVSHDPFVVYTSNIAAILGLRSLYFALSSLLHRFRYLHYGLAALLAFVAFKMLAAPWLEVPSPCRLRLLEPFLASAPLHRGSPGHPFLQVEAVPQSIEICTRGFSPSAGGGCPRSCHAGSATLFRRATAEPTRIEPCSRCLAFRGPATRYSLTQCAAALAEQPHWLQSGSPPKTHGSTCVRRSAE